MIALDCSYQALEQIARLDDGEYVRFREMLVAVLSDPWQPPIPVLWTHEAEYSVPFNNRVAFNYAIEIDEKYRHVRTDQLLKWAIDGEVEAIVRLRTVAPVQDPHE